MIGLYKRNAKAVNGFLSAEAATMITVLSATDPTWKTWLIAALTPIAAGAVVQRTTNTPV